MLTLGENHQYQERDAPWIRFHSVSDVKESAMRPFDEKAIAQDCSANEKSEWFGMPVQKILDAWHDMKTEGLLNGDLLHDCAFRYFVRTPFKRKASQDAHDEKLLPHLGIIKDRYNIQIGAAETVCERPLGLYVKLYDGRWANAVDKMPLEMLQEEILKCTRETGREWPDWDVCAKTVKRFLCSHALAGTPDMLVLREKSFDVHDYKTDKEIRTKGYFLKGQYGKTEKMLKPVDMLENCNYEMYCLQLHLYAILVERKWNIPLGMAYIHHWDRKFQKFNSMIVWDRRNHARALLKSFFEKMAA